MKDVNETAVLRCAEFLKKFFDFQNPSRIKNCTGSHRMIRPIGRLPSEWMLYHNIHLPRSAPRAGALGRMLGALERRRQLREQQEQIQTGLAEPPKVPAYRPRARPPS